MVVSSIEPITPKQVTLLEEFIEARMNRPFTLIFDVIELNEVTNELVQPAPAEGWLQTEPTR